MGTLALVVFAPTVPILAATMAVMGAFLGCMDVAMNANAVEVEKRLGRAIMSSSHGFWSLGGFIGGGLGGLVIAATGRETHVLLATAAALAVMLAAMPFLIGETRTPAPAKGEKRSGALAARLGHLHPRHDGAVLDGARGRRARLGGALPDQGAWVHTRHRLLRLRLFAGTMAVMRFLGDAVRNRFGAVATLRVSGLIGAAGMLGAAVAPADWLAIACFALPGLGIANMVPIVLSAAGNHPGASSGSGIAAVTMMGYSGILIAPSAIGFAAEHVGYRLTYGVLALLLVVVAVLAARVAAADRIGARGRGARRLMPHAPM